MAGEATFEARVEDDGQVRLRLDRPGVAAVSYTSDPRWLIEQIAEAANLDVIVEPRND